MDLHLIELWDIPKHGKLSFQITGMNLPTEQGGNRDF